MSGSKLLLWVGLGCLSTTAIAAAQAPATQHNAGRGGVYAGFDKNAYPGDEVLTALAKSFALGGFWLNNPPGMSSNPWLGKRGLVRSRGLGFAILFNGRLYADLKAGGKDAAAVGRSDAAEAVAAARREGFPAHAIIFLDQEEGGHLLPEQAAYLYGWIDSVQQSRYGAGVYCSAIAVSAGDPATTADEIMSHYSGRRGPAFWVANDQCPPAPGCVESLRPPLPSAGSRTGAAIWQYAQSPRRAQFTTECAGYAPDNTCYAPELPHSADTAVDLNSAASPDPSHGR